MLKPLVPAVMPLKGLMSIVNEELAVLEKPPDATPAIGPRMRTSLAAMGNALPATSGGTVTVLAPVTVSADRLTTLDAARLKSSANRDAPFDATLKELLGSRFTVTWI